MSGGDLVGLCLGLVGLCGDTPLSGLDSNHATAETELCIPGDLLPAIAFLPSHNFGTLVFCLPMHESRELGFAGLPAFLVAFATPLFALGGCGASGLIRRLSA